MLKNTQLRLPMLLKLPRSTKIVITGLTVILLAIDLILLYRAFAGTPNWYNLVDFSAYLEAGKAIYAGHDPYNILNMPTNLFWGTTEVHDGYAYPPLLAEIIGGAALLVGDNAARYIWLVLNLGVIVATFGFLLRGFGFRLSWPWIGLSLAVFLGLGMIRNDLYHGQVNFILVFLAVIGTWRYTHGDKRATGLFWGLLFVIKPFLAILVLWLLWRREWRAAGWAVATSAGLFVVSFVPLVLSQGFKAVQSWLQLQSYFSGPIYSSRPDNLSWHGLLLRLDTPNPFTVPWFSSQWIAMGLETSLILCILLVLLRGLGKPFQVANSIRLSPLLETSLVLAAAMSYGPLTEGDHLLLLFPGLIAIMATALPKFKSNAATTLSWLLTAAVWALFFLVIAVPFNIRVGVPAEARWTPQHNLAILGTGTYAMFLLVAALLLGISLGQERQLSKKAFADGAPQGILVEAVPG